LVFGEPGANRVRLFDKDGSAWIERRLPLEGPIGSGFGLSVAMSINSIGMVNNPRSLIPAIIAVVAPRGGGASGDMAFARVFRCFTLRCSQIGSDITGFGSNDKLVVDISSDGNVVSIGALRVIVDGLSPVILFERDLDTDTWIERPFEWPASASFGQLQGFEFFSGLSLSGNGDVLAVRSWTYTQTIDLSSSLREEDRKQIYRWDGSSWNPKGDNMINRITQGSSAGGNGRGRSLDLNEDGNSLVMGMVTSSGERGVRVFDWSETDNEWRPRGRSMSSGLPVSDLGQEGWTVSLSADGMVVAFGSGIVGERETSIHVYRNVGVGNWERLGMPLPAGEGYETSIALSVDGSVLGVGLPQATSDLTDTGGLTSVYEFPSFPSSSSCPPETSVLRLSLTTDNFPGDTTWEITLPSGRMMSGGPYVYGYPVADYWPSFSTFVHEVCIIPETCNTFTLYDKIDFRQNAIQNELPDGMTDPAGYALFLDGQRIESGKVYEAAERVYIGSECLTCQSPNSFFQMMVHTCVPLSWELRSGSTALFSGSNSNQFEAGLEFDCSSLDTFWEEMCIDETSCYEFVIRIPRVHAWLANIRNEDLFQYRIFVDKVEIGEQVVSIPEGFSRGESLVSVGVGSCT